MILAGAASVADAQITADADGSCQLLTATCDENGFEITFDSACRDSEYKAVHVNELYAQGLTINTGLATFGSAATANAECVFDDDDGDGVYKMNFNFRQCGTTHETPVSDTDNLIYYNAIQARIPININLKSFHKNF